ncbi:uncharacterized protein [Onthophagus taurus]|uniref:uncharacterized protein n=1 Tax=Onthophagus taurus TaxID=166361 RepID=UPI000C20CE6B|nr:uncharacterized protein LOC111425834 [Onthophagus taurus]
MEDGSDGPLEPIKNGEVMAKLPEETEEKQEPKTSIKINGNANANNANSEDSDDSSDFDALVIDESVNTKKKTRKGRQRGFKGFKNTGENHVHSNPYFKESIFELLEKAQGKKKEVKIKEDDKVVKNNNSNKIVEKKGKANPKLREYTQYLGLQPTLQFKCKKCLRAGFPSLGSLNVHILNCTQTPPLNNLTSTNNISGQTNIRVTRNVFLCSACGTYYENWNLFLHMREVHRRYICLYCLGMFSHPEKLSLHIVSKHNCVPNQINTPEEFYNIYKVPCFLMCCECQKGFTETDNFFEHQCLENSNKTTSKSTVKNSSKNSKPIDHVTGDSASQSPPPLENEIERIDETNCNETSANDNNDCNEDLNVIESKSAHEFKSMETREDHLTDSNYDDSTKIMSKEENDLIQPTNTQQLSPTHNLQEDERLSVDEEESIETRKVPKVRLKLPKTFDYQQEKLETEENYDSDDSEKLTMEVDQIENESQESNGNIVEIENHQNQDANRMQIAGVEVPIIELELEQPLDKFDIQVLLRKCLSLTIATCVYCNHARKISVNGKQLGLHAIAEHRFSAVVNSITAEELIPESFVARIKDSLPDLESVYFNLESNSSEAITFSHVFECFQCRYSTTVHKELYLHNRKMHAKSILLCIMCKSNFYSYSELICHLCPGLYELNSEIHFRCCMCVSDDLPSAFRLMVHVRKRHHACDVCLELCHNQSKLSNHVWKHKLHHLCYRCGIAYRNKPDITKHLFWKHGTESVLCKKCLQKKWPHVYHFCIPPLNFICEECNLSFSKSVYLMVHKRLHTGEKPHVCSEENCGERFISKKLLLKHEFKHREPQEEPPPIEPEKIEETVQSEQLENAEKENEGPIEAPEIIEEKPKPKVDVYDLPELNLSESDSDSDDENASKPNLLNAENLETNNESDKLEDKPVLETIWDDFRNYQAIKEKEEYESKIEEIKEKINLENILNDHDYCVIPEQPDLELREIDMSADHDYCTGPKNETPQIGQTASSKSPQKKKHEGSSSSDSSDSDSSSCTCGSNCSCSSSSGSSSSSSDSSESDSSSSEGRRRQEARRERRKQKANKKAEVETVDVVNNDNQPVIIPDVPIQESDLETTESDTDEDFYDKQPQELTSKILAEKKNQLLQMASIGPYINGSIMDGSRPPTPSLPEEPKKKKSKSKKKKKKNKSSKYDVENPITTINNYQSVAPLTLTLPKNSPIITPSYSPDPVQTPTPSHQQPSESDSNVRASKRRRVPNKFYGYSSDEEQEKVQPPVQKWRKTDLPSVPRSPLVVPPITIKTTPIPEQSRIPDFTHHIKPYRPPIIPKLKPLQIAEPESGTDSNDTSSDEEPPPAPPPIAAPPPPPLAQPQPALYCYCRCPYDEVSEMIGCDSSDCAIEWFHFECVGIMVPPKGQWFCPDCRKKKQQRRELLQGHTV